MMTFLVLVTSFIALNSVCTKGILTPIIGFCPNLNYPNRNAILDKRQLSRV